MIGQYSQSQSQSQGSQGGVTVALSGPGGGGDFLPFAGTLDSQRECPIDPEKLPLRDIRLERQMKLSAEAAKFAPRYARPIYADQERKIELVSENAIMPLTWHPVFLAQAVLAEFCAQDWQPHLASVLGAHPATQREVDAELKALVYLSMAERPRRLPEIISQAGDIRPYFNSLLGGSMVGKAASAALIETGLAVGMVVAMHFKYIVNRARPWQIYPPLLPPVATPAHPSYPNGHSLQSHIIAHSLALANSALEAPALAMAGRIAENREVAGLHFRSDTEAGKRLATKVMDLLVGLPRFREIRFRATNELFGMKPAPEEGR
jgi:acid phosphatase (class A)